MSLLISAKRSKTKRRKSKRKIRINSQGFKVVKGKCVVYIGDNVRQEIVNAVRDLYNDHSFNKTRKHIRYISIQYQKTNKYVGFWNNEKAKLTIIDDHRQTVQEFKSTLCHEVKGHTRWHLALKWRRLELIGFNKFATKCDPVSTYVRDNEKKWRGHDDDYDQEIAIDKKWNELKKIYGAYDVPLQLSKQTQKEYDDLKQKQKTNGHEFMTRYANEQHSAIAEIVCGYGGHETLLNQKDVDELKKLYEALHY